MTKRYADYTNAVNQLFETPFNEIYKQCNKKNRKRILPLIASVYRKWYFSSLIPETLVTPANIIESLNRHLNVTPNTTPTVTLRTPRNYTGLRFTPLEYTLARHPVAEDLRKLVSFCIPDIGLDMFDCMDNDQLTEAVTHLSLWDPHYAAYLLRIALHMGLIEKTPSLYANRATVAQDCASRLDVPDRQLLEEIVTATISSASAILSDTLQMPPDIFDEAFIRRILREPMETDVIFQRVFDRVGVDFIDVIEAGFSNDMDEFAVDVMNSTYMMGSLLDMYFFTPFGYYLKLIRPVYVLPFDFMNEILMLIDADFDHDDFFMSFFSPCSKYYLTDMGLAFFHVKPTRTNYVKVQESVPFLPFFEHFALNPENLKKAADLYKPEPQVYAHVYLLKIKSKADASLWFQVEMPCELTLQRLFLEIATYFNINRLTRYSFFYDETENPFSEYPAPGRIRRSKKDADIALDALDLPDNHKFVLVTYRQPNPFVADTDAANGVDRYVIEILQKKERNFNRYYPAVSKMSKSLQAIINREE